MVEPNFKKQTMLESAHMRLSNLNYFIEISQFAPLKQAGKKVEMEYFSSIKNLLREGEGKKMRRFSLLGPSAKCKCSMKQKDSVQ